MDANGKRFNNFRNNNSHIDFEIFPAIKGENLDKKELISNGLITKELSTSKLFTKGMAGCAVSHRTLWHKCTEENTSLFIMEDDCYTHPGIESFIKARLKTLTRIDICFFGVNTDVSQQSVSPEGLVSTTSYMPRFPEEKWIINALQKTNPAQVRFHKLLTAAGLCAYFITPSGAKRLLSEVFPLSLEVKQPYKNILPFSPDRAARKIYPKIKAAICQPFMAYTPNTDSSTKANATTGS